MSRLPIDATLPALKVALGAGRRLVLQAPPGAGKTTRVPLALLGEPWLAGRRILMLEPRRLAARAAAARMAALLGEPVGGTVGYRVRFEQNICAHTRIEVLTEGILTRRLQSDPELEGVGLVIFDEFHERHLHGDLALALCLDVMQALREDLALVIMSATLDAEAIGRWLDAPVLKSEGRSWPVELRHAPLQNQPDPGAAVAQAVRRALDETAGDVLAFLPGAGEIQRAAELLQDAPVQLHALYGDLPLDAQQRAIAPDAEGRRKVVLATNIAESSLTIEGVRVVVDSGWARVPRFDPNTAFTRLEPVRISRASAEQRAGRAGRLAPGVCYRLWSEGVQRGLIPHHPPEILHADLAPLALELARWGVQDAADLRWLDAPPAGALAQARDLLMQLEALDAGGRLTALGRQMADWPLHPRLSHMLLRARTRGLDALACDAAALLSERDVLRGQRRSCEFSRRVLALHAWRQEGRAGAGRHGADASACAIVDRVARRWRERLGVGAAAAADADRLGELLALAFPERLALRRESGRYRLANGRGARLAPDCVLQNAPLLAIAELGGAGEDALVRTAAPIERSVLIDLLGERLVWRVCLDWDETTQAVRAQRLRAFGALELESRALDAPDGEAVAAVLLAALRRLGLEVLPWNEESRQLQARVLSLRAWQGEANWPDWSDAGLLAALEDWLLPHLAGMSRRSHLARLDLAAILRGHLGWERAQRLDASAPTHLQVPSGSRKRLRYEPGQPPVLAVKLQELFGLADTPRVANGAVPVLLHLLSPAQRPIQVTQDLRGFWQRTYAEVKKELKGRYPKHPWPDDPWTAQPTARTRRK